MLKNFFLKTHLQVIYVQLIIGISWEVQRVLASIISPLKRDCTFLIIWTFHTYEAHHSVSLKMFPVVNVFAMHTTLGLVPGIFDSKRQI